MSGLQDYADGVRAVLDALGIAQACVVGLSLGGMVAQALALSAPSRVNALVLAHTSARTDPAVAEIWRGRIAQLESEGLEAQVATTLARWFTPDFAAQSPLTLQWVASLIRAATPAGYRCAAEAICRLDHLDALPAIRVPTLVVAGAEDVAVPPSAAGALASRIAGARLEVLQGAAHIGNVQQPLRFTEVVGQFIASALPQEVSP
jgi:3-oxoadipate enol-lactonase